jgi:hypothetical protein
MRRFVQSFFSGVPNLSKRVQCRRYVCFVVSIIGLKDTIVGENLNI